MKYFYGFAVIAQLLIAFITGDKTKVAYMLYLVSELFEIPISNTNKKLSLTVKKPEPELQPTHD